MVQSSEILYGSLYRPGFDRRRAEILLRVRSKIGLGAGKMTFEIKILIVLFIFCLSLFLRDKTRQANAVAYKELRCFCP